MLVTNLNALLVAGFTAASFFPNPLAVADGSPTHAPELAAMEQPTAQFATTGLMPERRPWKVRAGGNTFVGITSKAGYLVVVNNGKSDVHVTYESNVFWRGFTTTVLVPAGTTKRIRMYKNRSATIWDLDPTDGGSRGRYVLP